jgi:hypothetical protein
MRYIAWLPEPALAPLTLLDHLPCATNRPTIFWRRHCPYSLLPSGHGRCGLQRVVHWLVKMERFYSIGRTISSQPVRQFHSPFPMIGIVVKSMRGMEASFSKTTGNKTFEFGGVSPSNDLIRYKMESFYFYLI